MEATYADGEQTHLNVPVCTVSVLVYKWAERERDLNNVVTKFLQLLCLHTLVITVFMWSIAVVNAQIGTYKKKCTFNKGRF